MLSGSLLPRTHWAIGILVGVAIGAFAVISGTAAGAAEADYHLEWKAGELVAIGGQPSKRVLRVIRLINREQFEEVFDYLLALNVSERVRGELALAIAGHPNGQEESRALNLAERWLQRGVNSDKDLAAKRLLNQLKVYRALTDIVLPWARREKGHSWVPGRNLLPARDFALKGDLPAARRELGSLREEYGPLVHALIAWQLAGFFGGDEKHRRTYSVLLGEADQALKVAYDAADPQGKRRLAPFRPLLEEARRDELAVITLREAHLLFPRYMIEPLRAYYWWWRETERPVARQGFEEILPQMQARFPQHELVRLYAGERIYWGDEHRIDPVPDGAPAWAVDQRELRARASHVVEWWFNVRQEANGELGGGWEDDCEAIRGFCSVLMGSGLPSGVAGLTRLVDGIWESGELVNGYDRRMKDIEHSCEMAADTSVMVLLAYGDPLYFERFLETTKTTYELHTAVNAHGHRHYRSRALSATEVHEDDSVGFDTAYAGRAMRPAAMIAWYAHLPKAVDLVHSWAKAWSEDSVRAGESKPAGIIPAVVRFQDDSVDGGGKWWDAEIGGLYTFQPSGTQDEIIGKMMAAWELTGDDSVLDGLRAQLRIARSYRAKPIENPQVGTLEWAASQVAAPAPWMASWYRAVTGDDEFDDLALADIGYNRYLVSGETADIDAQHTHDLEAMRYNLPLLTSEVRKTDRIALRGGSLLGPLTGSPGRPTETPLFAMTWQSVGPDFAAVVRSSDSRSVRAQLYNFARRPLRPVARFWRLEPGRYALRVGADAKGEANVAGSVKTIEFTCVERLSEVAFELQPGVLTQLEVVQLEKGEARPRHLPDLAIASRDLKVLGAKKDQAMKCTLVLHNIGSARARDIRVHVRAIAKRGDSTPVDVATLNGGDLDFPADLVAKTKELEFTWMPSRSGLVRLEVEVECGDGEPEIYSGNNRAAVAVSVRK